MGFPSHACSKPRTAGGRHPLLFENRSFEAPHRWYIGRHAGQPEENHACVSRWCGGRRDFHGSRSLCLLHELPCRWSARVLRPQRDGVRRARSAATCRPRRTKWRCRARGCSGRDSRWTGRRGRARRRSRRHPRRTRRRRRPRRGQWLHPRCGLRQRSRAVDPPVPKGQPPDKSPTGGGTGGSGQLG